MAYPEHLATYPGVEVARGRVVADRNRIAGGAVTAGIDFAKGDAVGNVVLLLVLILLAIYATVMLFRVVRWVVQKLLGRTAKRIGFSFPMFRMVKGVGHGIRGVLELAELAYNIAAVLMILAAIVLGIAWLVDQAIG